MTSQVQSGFNLIGYATSPTGLGEDLRAFAAMLEHLEIPFSIIDVPTEAAGTVPVQFKHLCADQFACSVFFMSPMECQNLARVHPRLFSEPRLKIGYFLWELPDFPQEYLPSLKLVDHIWCPTKFVQAAFMAKSSQLTLALPLPVIQTPNSSLDFRKQLGIAPQDFVALYLFDIRSTLNRKNPQGVIAAFERFAKGKDDAHLILKIHRWQQTDHRQFRWIPNRSNVHLLGQSLSDAQLGSLYDSADCYLSLHRSEGFGRTLVEALQHGLWLVSTNYSGPADYVHENNTKIVGSIAQSVLKDDYPHNALSIWVDPQIDQACEALEALYAQKQVLNSALEPTVSKTSTARKKSKPSSGESTESTSQTHSALLRNAASYESGAQFTVPYLAKKYEPIFRSYLK